MPKTDKEARKEKRKKDVERKVGDTPFNFLTVTTVITVACMIL
jgi:hypothetical protein